MSVWQMLAAGLTLWLTHSPKYSGERKMASLWLKKPALFYEKEPYRFLYKFFLLNLVKINHLREKHCMDGVPYKSSHLVYKSYRSPHGGRKVASFHCQDKRGAGATATDCQDLLALKPEPFHTSSQQGRKHSTP